VPQNKPETMAEYLKWLRDNHQATRVGLSCSYYESVSNKIYMTVNDAPFWNEIVNKLNHFAQEYYLATEEYNLFGAEFKPVLRIKPFDSFINKSYRNNIIHNPNWTEPPDGGWLLPSNWYARINDIIRTMFVVKYLDGVSFLAERIIWLLEEQGLPSHVDFEAKEEGYYAAHLHTEYECEIPREDWDTLTVPVKIEMQITTQLQEVIKTLLHKHYEERRVKERVSEQKWQWDYSSDEFATNYLGHILHYVEGMIMDIREKQKEVTL
jgi:hypothetical protein